MSDTIRPLFSPYPQSFSPMKGLAISLSGFRRVMRARVDYQQLRERLAPRVGGSLFSHVEVARDQMRSSRSAPGLSRPHVHQQGRYLLLVMMFLLESFFAFGPRILKFGRLDPF